MRRSFTRIFCLFTSILFFPGIFSHAMDWPSAEASLEYNFAFNERGRPVAGSGFRAEGPVRSVNSGELIYYRDESDTASSLPSPFGVWLAVDHGDSLIGVYSRLDRTSVLSPYTLAEGDIVGFSGNSGWSREEGFFFSFYDRKEKRWVNPGMILPVQPDNRPPVIRSVVLQNREDRTFNLAQTRTVAQGPYRILVDALDTRTSPNDTPLAPHRLIASVNGREAGSLVFETLGAGRGKLKVSTRNNPVDAARTFAPFPALLLGEVSLARGQAVLEIIVEDLAGNSRDLSYRLIVE